MCHGPSLHRSYNLLSYLCTAPCLIKHEDRAGCQSVCKIYASYFNVIPHAVHLSQKIPLTYKHDSPIDHFTKLQFHANAAQKYRGYRTPFP
jgi:hypothetical protein